MLPPAQNRRLLTALYLNAALLAVIAVGLFSRGSGTVFVPASFGATPVQPIAGGGNMYLMPAQFSTNTWGCYIMDIDAQTLCAYQFYPGEKQLRFVAARDFHWDRKLKNFNTTPSPAEIEKNSQLDQEHVRANTEKPPAESPDANK